MRNFFLSVIVGTLAVVFFLVFACHPTFAQSDDIDLSNAPSLHYKGRIVRIEPAFEDYLFMLEDICDALGFKNKECLIYTMNGDLSGNAVATILNGGKIIVYDRRLSPIVGYDGASMIIAHELAHHVCDHLTRKPDPTMELEADAFAGAAMRLMDRPLSSAMDAAVIFSERPGASHPSKAQRAKAIKAGWENPTLGKSCKYKDE